MSDLKDNSIAADISELKEKFFSGRSAQEDEQVKHLYDELQNVIKKIIVNNFLSSDSGLAAELTEIFQSVVRGKFANSLMESFDKEIYFGFGNYLLSNANREKIPKLIHEYLNLFRFSSFLQKILLWLRRTNGKSL